MRTRVFGSILVVVVGLIPLLIGGPVFALLMVLLGIAGYWEFLKLASSVNPATTGSHARFGYAVIAALGYAPLVDESAAPLLLIAFLAVATPLVLLLRRPLQQGGFTGWTLACSGSLYVGLPIYAAVATRASSGLVNAPWLSDAAHRLAINWDPAPRGLAWALTVVLATWVGDSVALFAGMALGKQKLAPAVSPNKTREGAVGGLAAAMFVGAVSVQSFGLGDWWIGLVAGAAIGIAGQLGDLAESVLKRQSGVKDSGSTIPGHGGVLDRIDALLFAFPAGFLMAVGLDRLGR